MSNATEPRNMTAKELAAMIDRLEFLLEADTTGRTREMERGLENYKAELRRREKLVKTK